MSAIRNFYQINPSVNIYKSVDQSLHIMKKIYKLTHKYANLCNQWQLNSPQTMQNDIKLAHVLISSVQFTIQYKIINN